MQNELIVDVRLWGSLVGVLAWDESSDCAVFEYDPKFVRKDLNIAPLTMPLRVGRPYSFPANKGRCFKGLPGLIADSLPDDFGTQIIREWFVAQGYALSEVTPLESLCYMGKRSMGALEFEPSKKNAELDSSSRIYVDDLVRMAGDILAKRCDFKTLLKQDDKSLYDILKVGTSAGGAKPKAIIAYNEETGEVRSGQVEAPEDFGYWLLKFDGVKFREHDSITEIPRGIGAVEYAYYQMAVRAGIEMSECRLFQDGDSRHFMTRRFDRSADGKKIHMQTLSALAHYDRDARHSYEEAFLVMQNLGLDNAALGQMFRRAVFNVMARNNDDHSKNISFLMDEDGKWKLAPAYDLCYSNNPESRWINRHQMSLCGKCDGHTADDFIKLAKFVGIRHYAEIIEQVREAVSCWQEIAKDCGVRKNHVKEIESNLLYGMD